MYKTGEGCRVNYHKAIHHLSVQVNLCKYGSYSEKAHLELADIFEIAKGFVNPNRALLHLRSVADLKHRRDEGSNQRVAWYFVRSTPPRKISFTTHEMKLSLRRIRNAHSQEGRDIPISILEFEGSLVGNHDDIATGTAPNLSRNFRNQGASSNAASGDAPSLIERVPSEATVPAGYKDVPIAAQHTNLLRCIIAILIASLFFNILLFFQRF